MSSPRSGIALHGEGEREYHATMHVDDTRSSWRGMAQAWAVLGVVLVLIAAIQVPLNASHVSAMAKYQQLQLTDRQAERAMLRLLRHVPERDDRVVPLGVVESVLNGGRPLERDLARNLVWWKDPATGGEAALRVDNWESPMANPWPSVPSRRTYPQASAAYEAVELARRLAYIGCYCLWGLLLLLFAGVVRRGQHRLRLQWCNALLMAAVAGTALSLIGPQYLAAATQFFEDDAAGVGWVEIGVSLLLLLTVYLLGRQGADAMPRCAKCRYNLTGNLSGVCPECGTTIPAATVYRL